MTFSVEMLSLDKIQYLFLVIYTESFRAGGSIFVKNRSYLNIIKIYIYPWFTPAIEI